MLARQFQEDHQNCCLISISFMPNAQSLAILKESVTFVSPYIYLCSFLVLGYYERVELL